MAGPNERYIEDADDADDLRALDEEQPKSARQIPIGQLPFDVLKLRQESDRVAADPQFQASAPIESKKSLAQAMDRAEELYNKRAEANQWGEVAQMLARAAVQFGAAQRGLQTGQDMSNLNLGTGVDYSKRTDRAATDYQQQLRNLAALTQAGEDDYKAREGYKKTAKANALEPIEGTIKSAEDRERLESAERLASMHEAGANTRAESANRRVAASEKRADDRLKKLEERDTYNRTINELKNDEDDQQKVVAELQKDQKLKEQALAVVDDPDLSSKDRDKLKKANPYISQLETDLSKEDSGWQLFGGRSQELDDRAKADIREQYKQPSKSLREALNRLADIRSKRKALASGKASAQEVLSGEPSVPAPKAAAAQEPSGPKQDPKIQQYADQYLKGDYQQAKKVLVGRGYKPAE